MVELVPVDVTTVEPSYLTLSLVVFDGIAFLQIDTEDAVFVSDAESLIVDVDGRRNRFGVNVGSTMGVRIGELLGIEQINVAISAVDAADLVVQTTETIELLPLLTVP